MKEKNEKKINPRETALDIIIEVLEHEKYLKDYLENASFNALNGRDKGFVNSLAHGVVEKKLTLDFVINKFSKLNTKKMKPVIRNILRMGLYEIMYFDRTPDSASINEAVKLSKKKGLQGLSGFVNGILRNISRNKDNIISEINNTKDIEIKYSVPNEIFEGFTKDYGTEKAIQIAEKSQNKREITARVMTKKLSSAELNKKLKDENIDSEILDKFSIIIKKPENISNSKCFKEGLFYIQDLSSMQVEKDFSKSTNYFERKDSFSLLDLCAAPGGKSIDFADSYGDKVDILSLDISDKKVKKIEENIKRLSFSNISTGKNNAEVFNKDFLRKFDIVLLDVPCSGLGTMSHRPEIKYRQSEEGYAALQKIQRKIIDNSLEYVKPGGYIIYSTCTMRKAENEDNIDYLLKKRALKKIKEETIFPDSLHDGFFISILKNED